MNFSSSTTITFFKFLLFVTSTASSSALFFYLSKFTQSPISVKILMVPSMKWQQCIQLHLVERSLHNSNSVITCLSADISDFQKSLFDLPFFGGVKKPLFLKIWRFIRHFQLLNNSAIMHYKLVSISNSKPKLKSLLLSPKKPFSNSFIQYNKPPMSVTFFYYLFLYSYNCKLNAFLNHQYTGMSYSSCNQDSLKCRSVD